MNDTQLCPNDIHAIKIGDVVNGGADYACYPAVAIKDSVPAPRWSHAACARRDTIIIHGGQGEQGQPPDESHCLWEWDSTAVRWSTITTAGEGPASRHDHQLFYDPTYDILVLHGGSEEGKPAQASWLFDFESRNWSEIPPPPVVSSLAQYVNGTMYCIGSETDLNGSIYSLRLASSKDENNTSEWDKVDFPTNPLATGPRLSLGGRLVPVSTGAGRHYLFWLCGIGNTGSSGMVLPSTMWSLQLPSGPLTGAGIKDAIRNTIPGIESGVFRWHEVEISFAEDGKLSDDMRTFYGIDRCLDGKGAVVWGGRAGGGSGCLADGWLLKFT